MATLNDRLKLLEILSRPLTAFSDEELDARITSILGYLPNEKESAELIKQLRHEISAGKGKEKKYGNT